MGSWLKCSLLIFFSVIGSFSDEDSSSNVYEAVVQGIVTIPCEGKKYIDCKEPTSHCQNKSVYWSKNGRRTVYNATNLYVHIHESATFICYIKVVQDGKEHVVTGNTFRLWNIKEDDIIRMKPKVSVNKNTSTKPESINVRWKIDAAEEWPKRVHLIIHNSVQGPPTHAGANYTLEGEETVALADADFDAWAEVTIELLGLEGRIFNASTLSEKVHYEKIQERLEVVNLTVQRKENSTTYALSWDVPSNATIILFSISVHGNMRLKTLSNREKYRLLFMVGGRAMLQKPYKGEISAATLFGLYRTVIFTVQPAVGPTFRAVTKVVLPDVHLEIRGAMHYIIRDLTCANYTMTEDQGFWENMVAALGPVTQGTKGSAGLFDESSRFGVSTCFVKKRTAQRYEPTTTVMVFVLRDPPIIEEFEVKVNETRPRTIRVLWKVDWEVFTDARRVDVVVQGPAVRGRFLGGAFIGKETGIGEYSAPNDGGMLTITITASHDTGLPIAVREDTLNVTSIEEIMVINIKSEVREEKIFLHWDASGARPGENPSYSLSVYNQGRSQHVLELQRDVDQKAAEVDIKSRPAHYLIFVSAILPGYRGPESDKLQIILPKLEVEVKVDQQEHQIRIEWRTMWHWTTTEDINVLIAIEKQGSGTVLKKEEKKDRGRLTYRAERQGGIFKVTAKLSGYEIQPTSYEKDSIKVEQLDDIRVENLKHEVMRHDVILSWDAKGVQPWEDAAFRVRVRSAMSSSESVVARIETRDMTAKFHIERRPSRYHVEVAAKVGSYRGPPSSVVVDVSELAPDEAPTNMKADLTSGTDVQIHFDPPSLEKSGEDKGCKVYACKEKAVTRECLKQTSKPRMGNVQFKDLEYAVVYFIAAECYTNAGPGPLSTWVTVQTEKSPSPEDNTDVSIKVQTGINTVISWSVLWSDGRPLQLKYIKELEILMFKWPNTESGAERALKRTIHRGITVDQINTGLSPGFKFDTNCYSYAINVTFQNGAYIFKETEEECYSELSPSFIMLYVGSFLGVLGMLCLMCRLKKEAARPPRRKQVPVSSSKGRSSTSATK